MPSGYAKLDISARKDATPLMKAIYFDMIANGDKPHSSLTTSGKNAMRGLHNRKVVEPDPARPWMWQLKKHANGQPMYSPRGTLLDDKGNRSVFDDIDN